MNAWMADFLSNSAAQRMAWALIHFLWQGTAVAVLLAMGLRLLRRNSSQVRWAVSCGALGLMAALPVVTACMVSVEAPSAAAVERVAEAPAPPGRAAPASVGAPPAESSPSPLPTLAPGKDPISPTAAATEHALQPSGAEADSATSWPRQARDIFGPALPWALGVWLVGVVGMTLWNLGGWLELRRLRMGGVGPPGPEILDAFSRLVLHLQIRQRMRLLISVRVAVPTVIGWLRPVILLPAQVISGLTAGQLEAVLIHELAHIRRYDCLVRLIQAVVETLLFYHPAVWWVSRCISQESEHCCDELAVEVCGGRRDYARALARAAELGRRKLPLAAAATGGKLLPRIRRIIGLPDRGSVGANCWLAGLLIMAGLLAAGLIVYGGAAQAQTQQPVAQPAQKTATASAASKVSASPGKKELADAHAFLQSLLNPQELTPKDKARIKKLIAALGNNDWQVREKATVDLSGLGPEALPLVQAAAKSKDREVVIRAGRIGEAIEARVGDRGAELAPVIDVLTAGRDKRLVGMLIELLGHPSVWARYAAEYGLRRITGKAFGYNAYGDVGRRAAAVEKWRKWWKESKAKFSYERAASQSKQFGLLICDSPGRILMAVTPAGKVVWTRKLGRRINGLAGLPNGNVLVGYDSGERTVEEFDRDFKPVWNADGVRDGSGRVCDVSRLANGNTLIAYVLPRGHVLEVTPAGKIVWQKTNLRTPASASRLANGNTLICEHKQNRVIEVNRAGNIVWQKADLKRPHDAEKLANGNVLIGTSGKRVVEVNRAGKIVWERRCSGEAVGVCRLPDGSTGIFILGEGAILVDRGGKKTRELYKSKTIWGKIRVAPTMPLKGNRPGVRPSSRPATRPGEWGKPVEGVQVRLRNVEGDLYADVRNTGKRKFSLGAIQQMAKLERDGRVFPYARDFAVIRSPFGPGREYRDIRIHPESFVAVLPGKHVLRVAFTAEPANGVAGSSVEAWSNPVEIEIVPDDNLAVESLKKLGWRPMEKTNLIWDGKGRVSSIDIFAPSRDVPVTDAWLVPLKGMSELRMLYLGDTPITDAGLVHLKGLTKLNVLDLGNTQITDTGLAHLSGLAKLQRLELTGTKVTDAGLVRLERLTSLKSLFLGSTSVTKKGAERLKRALPKAKVYLGEATNDVTGELAEGASFGPVTERVVAYRKGFPGPAVPQPGPMYLDLDTGAYAKFKALPDSKMIRKAGVDVYYEPKADGTGARLATSNMQLQPLSDKTGWNSSPRHVRRALAVASPYSLTYPGRSTLAFKTRDGGLGILHILGFTKDRQGIRIRYKLVRPSSPAATRPTTRPGAAAGAPAKQLERLWAALGSADGTEADKAVAGMAALKGRAVAFLAARLTPAPADAARVRRLVAKFDDAAFVVREKASTELLKIGRAALPALRKTLTEPALSAEARARVKKLVKHWSDPYANTAQARRTKAAVQVLARIETAPSKAMLARLAPEGWFPWGKAIKGVQVRLRAAKLTWQADDSPVFKADVRNRGKLTFSVYLYDLYGCEIEVDTVWHRYPGPRARLIRRVSLEPGSERVGIHVKPTAMSGGKCLWTAKADGPKPGDKGVPLALPPGKHTIRVAVLAWPRGDPAKPKYIPPIRVVSHPVQIEVVAPEKG